MTNSTQELLIDETVCVLEGMFQYKDSKPSNNHMVKLNKVSLNKRSMSTHTINIDVYFILSAYVTF